MLIETDEQDFLHDKATSLFDLTETVKTSKSVFVNLTKKKLLSFSHGIWKEWREPEIQLKQKSLLKRFKIKIMNIYVLMLN